MRQTLATATRHPCGFALPVRHRRATGNSNLSALLRLLGADDAISAHSDAHPVTVRQLCAGATLFHEGGNAESVGFVHVGSLKLFTTAEDGYQQVVEFVEQGDVLGFDALCTGRHPSTAQALEDAWVYSVRVADLFKLCHDVPALDRALHLATSRQLARRSELADVMAAVAADVRLARFLVHLAGQMEALGRSPRRFVLRMTRRDLASQLGVAHETVSRSFTALAQWGGVRVDIREVEILDFDRLKAFSRCVRVTGAEPDAPDSGRRRTGRRNIATRQPMAGHA
ncbi:MAG: Crp/Fnr family transcriptional regulator [Burkholderiaceae bacterium]